MELDEYFITKSFQSVTESLSLFKDDPLVHSPGSEFLYSTHAWTLISAILEAVAKEPFEKHIIKMAKELGMDHTYLDENSPLIYHRGRHYMKNKSGKKLINCPYVDLSYKWAGGGLLSTVTDLLQFGNVMLYSYQIPSSSSKQNSAKNSTVNQNNTVKPGFLKPETVKSVWAPLYKYGKKDDFFYGMGWFVNEENQKYGQGKQTKFCVSHTGNAVGGSSVLLILPPSSKAMDNPPKGVVVAIIVNMISVNLDPAARDVAELFENYYLGQDESA